MAKDQEVKGRAAPPRVVRVEGEVQGLVIGDHNTITQHFHVQTGKFPTPRESPLITAQVIGRGALITELKEQLLSQTDATVLALCGMAGVGKSTLAAHVATMSEVEGMFPDGCFWVDLQNGDLMEAFARMAQAFGQNVDAYENAGSRSRAVRSLLHDKRILTVLDNAGQESEVTLFLPANPESAMLVTTRDEGLAYTVTEQVIRVDRLDRTDATEMLVRKAGAGQNEEYLDIIASLADSELGGLPLALELVGKQARKEARRPGFSWGAFRERFREGRKRLGLGRGEHTIRNAFEQTWTSALDDVGRKHFSLLGLFPRGDLLTGEIAAAWNENSSALEGLNELIDLSLIQQMSPVTLQLHPLMQDFAEEKMQDLEVSEQVAAHQRICDYHFERAPAKPQSWQDIQPVLRSHYHAWKAYDKERAGRVFPWFKKQDDPFGASVAVPGFLIDHGYRLTLVRHYEIDLEFAKGEGDIPWAYAEYWLGDALASIGELVVASQHLKESLAIIGNSDASEAGKDMARSKFSFRTGQICAGVGDLDGAIDAYRTALEIDRREGQIGNALITMLQIGDLSRQKGDEEGLNEAFAVYEEARNLAQKDVYPAEEAMALARLAELARHANPERAGQYLQDALELDKASGSIPINEFSSRVISSAFIGRQGARYATQLGQLAAEMALSGHPTLPLALNAFSIAITRSGDAESWYEQSVAFYWLGNLFEHLFLLDGHDAERPAAWACYELAGRISGEMELPPGINPKERLENNILLHIDAEERRKLSPLIDTAPLQIIQKALDRLTESSPQNK